MASDIDEIISIFDRVIGVLERQQTQIDDLSAQVEQFKALLAADDEADMIAGAEAQRRLDDPADGVVSFEQVAAGLGMQDA